VTEPEPDDGERAGEVAAAGVPTQLAADCIDTAAEPCGGVVSRPPERVEWARVCTVAQAGPPMRRFPKTLPVVLVAVVVVGGLALVGSSIGSTAATPAPTTAAPAPNSAVQSWQAFQAHVASSLPGLETDINAVVSAGSAADITATSSAADAVKADASGEVAWLQANPAALCYQAVYNDYLSANQTLEAAMNDAISGSYTAANALIGRFNTALSTMVGDTANTAC